MLKMDIGTRTRRARLRLPYQLACTGVDDINGIAEVVVIRAQIPEIPLSSIFAGIMPFLAADARTQMSLMQARRRCGRIPIPRGGGGRFAVGSPRATYRAEALSHTYRSNTRTVIDDGASAVR